MNKNNMPDDLFDALISRVSIGIEHPNLFMYDESVCYLRCLALPATKKDYAIVSVETDDAGYPYIEVPLMDIEPKNLKMFVEVDILSTLQETK